MDYNRIPRNIGLLDGLRADPSGRTTGFSLLVVVIRMVYAPGADSSCMKSNRLRRNPARGPDRHSLAGQSCEKMVGSLMGIANEARS